MVTQTEGKTIGDVVRREYEADSAYCREAATLKTGVAGDIGDLVHIDGSDVDILNVVGDGALTIGVLLTKVADDATDRSCLILSRGPSIVRKSDLDYGSGTVADADAALIALGILPRD